MSVFDPPTVLEILKLSHFGAQAQQRFVADWKKSTEKRVNTWLGSRSGDVQLTKQLTWESQVVEYVNFVYKSTTEHGNKKNGFGPPPLPKGIPILGPRFLPPTLFDITKRGLTTLEPGSLYIRPINIIHPFYYDIAQCPQCDSTDIKWDSWTGAGSREIHGLYFEEKALGFQLRCAPCKAKYGKHGTDVGARNAEGEKYCSSFATTNAVFWARWEHWKIPPGIPYFSYRSGVTRELFDFIVELRPSTTAGGLEENIKQFHLLEYNKRHLAYLNSYKSHSFKTPLESFSAPNDRSGYNDKCISNDMISDIFREFTKRTREVECSQYLRTLSAICMNLDNTFKAAKKATVADSSKARTHLMNGGILSVLNERNEIIAWLTDLQRFCQTAAAAEMVELLQGLKDRFEMLGVPAPEMVTIDNCCTFGNKIRTVFEAIKVLLDVHHFLMRYSGHTFYHTRRGTNQSDSYAAGVLGGTQNPRRAEVLKDIRDSIIKERATKDTFSQYWPHSEQVVRLIAAYNKWAQKGVWSAAASNIHATQLEHVRKGCMARPREDIPSDGSRIEGSHKGWNSLQRSFASGLETQTSLAHDFVLRRNIRTALTGKYKSSKPFVKSTFGSHHIALVDHTAATWNDLVAADKRGVLCPLPRLDNIDSGEKFGVVTSEHIESFGGLLTIKEEDEDVDEMITLDAEEQEQLMKELNLDPALYIQPLAQPLAQQMPRVDNTLAPGYAAQFQPQSSVSNAPTITTDHTMDLEVISVVLSNGMKRKDPPEPSSSDSVSVPQTKIRKLKDSDRPIHPFFTGTASEAKTITNPPVLLTKSPESTPMVKSLAQLTAPLPLPAASTGSKKLTRTQQFFASSTGTDPQSLSIQHGAEWHLFMRLRSKLQWRAVDMTPKKWVTATTAYNNELRTLPTSSKQSLAPKNPRALVQQLGDIETKITQRIANKNFASQSGKTSFWTEHCFAVPFIKTETGGYFPTAGTVPEDAAQSMPKRKAQTCTRCRVVKYTGGEGNKSNHKLKYCSDGFKVKLDSKEPVAPWPQPAGIFTDGASFHPRVFLAQVGELYTNLVVEGQKQESFTLEQDAFYQLLGKRMVVDEETGAVMFRLFTDFAIPASDDIPSDLLVEYQGKPHLFINALREESVSLPTST
ncbi:hypothetical protein R3P38DRAFT_3167271 [Favolaschia claudopus]|uniref:Integrase catalytic domain-containing protein n=1 Tax=Favolaschia claudopus TaxID=2862362 RepID=A0AAW0EDG9_9AGAR